LYGEKNAGQQQTTTFLWEKNGATIRKVDRIGCTGQEGSAGINGSGFTYF